MSKKHVSKVLVDYVVISKQKLQEIKEKWKGLGESELAVNEVIKEILRLNGSKKWVCPFEKTCQGYWCDKCMEVLKNKSGS